jgi:molybdate transport system ATP-binding protein
MNTACIILNNITVQQHGKTVLHDISLHIKSNQHLAVTGNSGSGKTVLAKTVASHIFYKGKIEISFTGNKKLFPKVVLAENAETWKNLSNISDFYYQQRFNSCDAENAITVAQSLELVTSHLSAKEKEIKISQWLAQFNLLHRANTPLIQLSNGEQKKLQLIKVLLQQPQVLILDKAFTGLDSKSRKELHNILNALAAEGTTIILITDDKELPDCITHVAELKDGKLDFFSAKEDYLFSQYLKGKETVSLSNELPKLLSQQAFDTIVEIKNTTVQYGNKIILENINWKIKQGEKWLVKGPNGAGKSTLLSLITADNLQAYSNEVFLFDKRRGKGESIWDVKKKIGYVSPELHKYFDTNISVYQTIASGFFDTMGLYKKLNNEQKNILTEWIDFFELARFADHALSSLSAGQQRWALLARALVKQPPLLVLDEPCQGLDDEHIHQFVSLINNICHQSNTTLIYVSHYDDDLPSCIQYKMELTDGKQIIQKKSQEVFAA